MSKKRTDFKGILKGTGIEIRHMRYYHPTNGLEGVRTFITRGDESWRVAGRHYDYLQSAFGKPKSNNSLKISDATLDDLLTRMDYMSRNGYLELQDRAAAEVVAGEGGLIDDFAEVPRRRFGPAWFPSTEVATEIACALMFPQYMQELNEEEVQIERIVL